MEHFRYPESTAGDDVDIAAGVSFPDPYRWLEHENDDVRRWQAVQSELADRHVKSWPYFGTLKDSVRRYFVDRVGTLPRFMAGRWFRAKQGSDSMPPRVVVSASAYGEGLEIAIPIARTQSKSPFISWVCPSPDGRIVALGLCFDGSENNFVHVIETDSGKALDPSPPQRLMDAWMGGVCWAPDCSGFYFLALEENSPVFRQMVLFHDIATGTQRREEIPLPDPQLPDYTLITVSLDGRYLVASHGLFAPRPVAIKRVSEQGSKWTPFITRACGVVYGFVLNDSFIAVTDIGASRGRIVSIPIQSEDPNDSRQWAELVAESDFVIRSVQSVGDHFYVTGFAETYSRVRVFRRDGSPVGDLPLPGRGAIAEPLFPSMTQIPTGHPDEYYYVFSSLTQSWGVYRHRPGQLTVETVKEPEVRLENAVVTDHSAVTADGVSIPYHTVHLAGVERNVPSPALIYAYGAFNVALLPEYPGAMAAFVAAGGIYVHGHIRGGAELGYDWWRSGRMKDKQNCFQDLYVIAEDLIAKGLTTREMLAMTGRSNGGLMAGVALTQRPDLWRVIVAQVPIMDVIGMPRDRYGRYALASEYGDPDDPDEVMRMAAFSPYHLVKSGTVYPPIYIEAGGTDPRCPPWQARKFAARLQAVTVNREPRVLLQVRDNAGHGFATDKTIQLESYTGWLAFILSQLNMRPNRSDQAGKPDVS